MVFWDFFSGWFVSRAAASPLCIGSFSPTYGELLTLAHSPLYSISPRQADIHSNHTARMRSGGGAEGSSTRPSRRCAGDSSSSTRCLVLAPPWFPWDAPSI